MKKLLGGCLVIAVLGAIALGVGAYYVYRAATPLLDDARGYLAGMSQLDDLERDIRNTTPHTPPASGELTAEQVARFVRVQEHVRVALGQRMQEIESKYEYLKGNNGSGATVGFLDLVNSLRDMTNVYVDARRFQVEALNKEGFSQSEYSWVRDRMFQAAGMEITSGVDLRKLEEAIRQGTGIQDITVDRLPRPNVPPKNRELVKPHLERMNEWIPLVFFGL